MRRTLARISALFSRQSLDATLDAELRSHLEMATDENIRAGMDPNEARRQALVAMGGMAQARELQRETRGIPVVDNLRQDFRYALRTLGRDIAFTGFALAILAFGIGSTTAVFSILSALLIRPLPFHEPDRLVWMTGDTRPGLSGQTIQVGHFLDFREANQSFKDMAAYFAFYGIGESRLTGRGEPERFTTVPVSQNFFQVLGVRPLIGRTFNADECRWRGPLAIMLSYRVWQRRFNSDPTIVGTKLILNDQPVPVIGILPQSFDFAGIFAPGQKIDMFSAFPLTPETNRWGNTLSVVGRLKAGVGVTSAQAEASLLAQQIAKAHPERNNFRGHLQTLSDRVSGRFRTALFLLAGAVGLVMLIVCANLSNLLLVRGSTRGREMAVRAALGAGRGRLIRQLLTESILLAIGGAIVGVLLAAFATRALTRFDSLGIPLLKSVELDPAAAVFAVLTALGAGVLFGLVPALQLSVLAPSEALKQGTRSTTSGKAHGWLRRALVAVEVALACILLVSSGLLIRSFLRILDVNLGFRPENALALRMDLPRPERSIAVRNRFISDALRLSQESPGVERAGLVDTLPLGSNRTWGVRSLDKTYRQAEFELTFVRLASEGYLGAMGIELIEGRDFTERDTPESERVIIINQTLARRLWPEGGAIGRKLRADGERRVIGVVRDVRHLALEQDSGSEMYIPMRQSTDYGAMDLVVRGDRQPGDLAAGVRTTLRELDPNIPAGDFRTLRDIVDRSVSPRRFFIVLLSGFAAFALVLASLGLYAVISYSVSQRRQEIGIRIALGASARELGTSVLSETLRLALAGLVMGGVASWMLSGAIRSMLFGVTASDPLTFGVMPVVILTVAGLAAWIPARRVARLDPVAALRAD